MKNGFLKLLPLLLIYLLLAILLSSTTFEGDEGNYVDVAISLSQGSFFSNIERNLYRGPGYPLALAPLALLRLPWFTAKLLNAFFLFGAIIYFYKTLALWLNENYALIFAFVMGLYPPFMRWVHLIYSENLVFLLICGFMFHFCKSQRESKNTWLHFLMSSFFLAYLALTKVLFGYVILVGLLSFLFLYLWKKREEVKKITYIYLLALIFCLPYLMLTYSLTGKIFYWATSGGNNFYWISTPYDNEWGNYFSDQAVQERPELAQHKMFFDKLAGLSQEEIDSEYNKKAIDNITHYPTKYFRNWTANIGRLLFSYPFSYTQQKLSTYFYLFPNMFIVVFFLLSIYPAFLRRKLIPFEIFALLYFNLVAFGGSSLLAADTRQFIPLVPILMLWLSFLYIRVMKIEIRPESQITSF